VSSSKEEVGVTGGAGKERGIKDCVLMQNSSYVGICAAASELQSALYMLSMMLGAAPLVAKHVNYSTLYKPKLKLLFGAKTALDLRIPVCECNIKKVEREKPVSFCIIMTHTIWTG
jgi:hypothetical protein